MTDSMEDRVAELEGERMLVSHRLDTIDGKLAEMGVAITRVSDKMDNITRLQEADVRHADSIARALQEIADLRRDQRDAINAIYSRIERTSGHSDDRLRAIADAAHAADRKIAMFGGVLACVQIIMALVSYGYTQQMTANTKTNDGQDAHIAAIASQAADNTRRVSVLEEWMQEQQRIKP